MKKQIIYVFIIIVTVLTLGGVFFYMYSETRENGYQDAIDNNTMIAHEIQTNVENLIDNNFNVIELLATYPEIQTFDTSILDPVLDDATSVYTNLHPIGVSDHTGMQIAKSNGATKVDISDRAHFIGPMQNGEKYISNILTSKADGSYICIMSVPIIDPSTSKPNGVIIGMLNLQVLNEYLQSVDIDISEKILSNTTSYIVDSEGYLLAHPEYSFEIGDKRPDYSNFVFIQDALNGNSNSTSYINENEEEILVSYVFEESTGWIICSEIPMNVAHDELAERLIRILIVYLLVISILIVIIIVLILNIRKRREAEKSLMLLNDSLEEKVEQRSEELRKTIRELTDKERMASLGSLVAGVSHEVNTPIGVAITASTYIEKNNNEAYSQLKSGNFSKDDLIEYMKKMDESSGIINNNLNRAAELVKNFKSLAVNQSVQEKITFNLKSYIDSVVLAMKHEYKNRPIAIDVNIDKTIEITSYAGDYSQIVTNLLMNSLKHAFDLNDPGKITIEGYKKGDHLIFVYSDDGKGMDEDTRRRIFDPFFTTDRGAGNSGLGMNIIYNIVNDRLNGSISCISNEGSGVRFEIQIPIEKRGMSHE